MSHLNESQKTVCQLLSEILFSNHIEIANDIDWNGVYQEALSQAVVIPALMNIEDYSLDLKLKQKIKNSINGYVYNTVQNYYCHSEIIQLLSSHDIKCCILKGVASSLYYPDQMIRQMGDIDFLVEESQIEEAEKILQDNGYTLMNHTHQHHILYDKDSMHFEMHFQPPGLPDGEMNKTIKEYFKDIFDESKKVSVDSFEYIIPSEFHHGLVMLLHMHGHMTSGGIGLRHLSDWAVFVHQLGNDKFKELFEVKLKDMGLWKLAKTISIASELAIGLPHQEWMGDDIHLSQSILDEILVGGNFGRKSPQRAYEGLFIDRKGVSHHRVVQFFISLNNIVYAYWPLFKKIKICVPIGYLIILIRSIRKKLKGGYKNVSLIRSFFKSHERTDLYSQIEVFKKE